jgi:lysyl-tRNA synthetase class I
MTNLLDLDNDILQIIGDYVKFDNAYRMEKEKDFEKTDKLINYLKENNKLNKYEIKEVLYSSLFKSCYEPEDIKEYVVSRKLKRYIKNFNLSMKPNAIPFY